MKPANTSPPNRGRFGARAFRALTLGWPSPRSIPSGISYLAALGIDAIGSGLFLPYAVLYFHFVVGLSLAKVGAGLSIGIATTLVLLPLTGALVDRVGALPIAVASLLARAGAYVAYLWVDDFASFVAVTIVVATGDRVWPTVNQALVAELVASEARTAWFGAGRTIRHAGFGIGGLVAGGLVALDGATAYRSLAVINALSFVAAGVLLLRLRGKRAAQIPSTAESAAVGYRTVIGDKRFRGLIVGLAPLTFLYVALLVVLPAYAIEFAGAPDWTPGALFTLNTLLVVASQMQILHRTHKLGDGARVRLGSALLAGSYALFALALALPNAVAVAFYLAACVVVFTLGEELFYPASVSLVADVAPEAGRGRYMASYQLLYSASNALGPFLLMALLEWRAIVPWLVLAALATIALLVQVGIATNLNSRDRADAHAD